MLNAILDFVFPRISIITGKKLDEDVQSQYFSNEEIGMLPVLDEKDLKLLKSRIIADYAYSKFIFSEGDDFSKIVYHLKYGKMKRLGICLGEVLADGLKFYIEQKNIKPFDAVVPVPLHKTKLRERGYNQSEYLCKGICRKLDAEPIPDLIKRIRHTSTQTKLSREKRIENIKDAFTIRQEYSDRIQSMRIVLVDDVITTGSTINEAARVLKESGSGDILCCSLAMAK